jgi:hypothetical protein
MLQYDLAEDLARLNILQADIGIDRRLHVAVTENAPDELVLARPTLEDDSRRGMPKLMHGDADTSRLMDTFGDLSAERNLAYIAVVSSFQHRQIAVRQDSGHATIFKLIRRSWKPSSFRRQGKRAWPDLGQGPEWGCSGGRPEA